MLLSTYIYRAFQFYCMKRIAYLEFKGETLSGVVRVCFEGRKHFSLFSLGECLSRDDCDFLLLVERRVELHVLVGDLVDQHETFVLSQYFNEAQSHILNVAGLLQSLVDHSDFLRPDASVHCDHAELFDVLMQFLQVLHIAVNMVKRVASRRRREQHTGISTSNAFLDHWRLKRKQVRLSLVCSRVTLWSGVESTRTMSPIENGVLSIGADAVLGGGGGGVGVALTSGSSSLERESTFFFLLANGRCSRLDNAGLLVDGGRARRWSCVLRAGA